MKVHPVFAELMGNHTETFICVLFLNMWVLAGSKKTTENLVGNVVIRTFEAGYNALLIGYVHKDCYQFKHIFSKEWVQLSHLNGDDYLFSSNRFNNTMSMMVMNFSHSLKWANIDTFVSRVPIGNLEQLSSDQTSAMLVMKNVITTVFFAAFVYLNKAKFQSDVDVATFFKKVTIISNYIGCAALLIYRIKICHDRINELMRNLTAIATSLKGHIFVNITLAINLIASTSYIAYQSGIIKLKHSFGVVNGN